jgi:hypothetical protein
MRVLSDLHLRYTISVSMLLYLFEHMFQSSAFWDEVRHDNTMTLPRFGQTKMIVASTAYRGGRVRVGRIIMYRAEGSGGEVLNALSAAFLRN